MQAQHHNDQRSKKIGPHRDFTERHLEKGIATGDCITVRVGGSEPPKSTQTGLGEPNLIAP
jgi:hypothetical protein